MQLHAGAGVCRRGPAEETQTQIDGAGVNGVDALGQLNSQTLSCIQRARHADQMQRELLECAAVATLISVSERGARDVAAKAGEVQLAGLAAQAGSDVAQARSRR